MTRIFHIALASEWAAARSRGSYHTSTLGVSLEQEGFIHASRPEQVGPVFQNYYRDIREPLVLLTIETDRLTADWREDPVGDDTFPHVYGPLNVSAVVNVQPLNRRGGTDPFLVTFLRNAMGRIGAVAGLALGGILIAVVVRTRPRN